MQQGTPTVLWYKGHCGANLTATLQVHDDIMHETMYRDSIKSCTYVCMYMYLEKIFCDDVESPCVVRDSLQALAVQHNFKHLQEEV